MARPTKYGLTDPDGTKQQKRKSQASTQQRFEKPLEVAQDFVSGAVNVAQNVTTTVQSVAAGVNSVKTSVRGIRQAFGGGSELVTSNADDSFAKAEQLAAQYGIQPIDTKAMLGSDPYAADGNIPEMTAAEANAHKLKIQRQNNALDVRASKVAQGRKVMQLAREQTLLVGDVVQAHTARIEVGSKVIENQIAETNYRTKQSKLEQTEELFTQQTIATQGTINLTDGIREEWDLKFEKQQAKNTSLKLEVEGAIKSNEIRLQEMEALILQG